jgi:hypothetical protein
LRSKNNSMFILIGSLFVFKEGDIFLTEEKGCFMFQRLIITPYSNIRSSSYTKGEKECGYIFVYSRLRNKRNWKKDYVLSCLTDLEITHFIQN